MPDVAAYYAPKKINFCAYCLLANAFMSYQNFENIRLAFT